MTRTIAIASLVVCATLAVAQSPPTTSPASPPATQPQKPPANAHKLPADAAGAPEALKNSPRHGEWVDITVPASGGDGDGGQASKLHTWVVYPERKDNAPVVLVIHEIFGLSDWVRAVADQLAAEGFIAIAPDLLSGKGPGGGGTSSFPEGRARDAVSALSTDEVNQRLDAARAYGLSLPAATQKSACIGFCWGGSRSFDYAIHQPELNAAVVYYGSGPKGVNVYDSIECPVLGLYAIDDARVTSTVEPTARAMSSLGKSFTHLHYEGAGHGFLRQRSGGESESRDAANLKASQQAWSATIEFLKKNLE
jgi:carboxymethylenebutenolidase